MRIIGINQVTGSYSDAKATFICELSYEEIKGLRNFILGGYEYDIDKIKMSDFSGLTGRVEKAQEAEANLAGILRSHKDLTDYIDKARKGDA